MVSRFESLDLLDRCALKLREHAHPPLAEPPAGCAPASARRQSPARRRSPVSSPSRPRLGCHLPAKRDAPLPHARRPATPAEHVLGRGGGAKRRGGRAPPKKTAPTRVRARVSGLRKPSSVSRAGHPPRERDHSSRTRVTARLQQPTRRLGRAALSHESPRASPPYMALLQVGFTVPRSLPSARWALTPPFHPYRRASRRSGGLLSVALSSRSPSPGVTRHLALWSSDFPPALTPEGARTGDRMSS